MSFYSCLDYYNKISCPACLKQQVFISHTLSGREVQDQEAGKLTLWRRPSSQFADSCQPSCYLSIYLYIYILPCREGESKSSLVSSYKGTNLIMEALPFMNSSKPIYLPQAPSPKTTAFQISASTWIWGATNIQSIATWSLSKGLQPRAWEPGLHLLVVGMILFKNPVKKV